LLINLNDSWEEYAEEFNETGIFWNTVLRSLQDVAIIRIATLLDPRRDVVSVPNLLRIIKINAPGNGSKLGIEIQDFEKVGIDDDIKSVHKLDPVVDKILTLRNEVLAHRSINIVATHRINLLPELNNEEVNEILDLLYRIATKYAMLHGQNRTLRSMVGSDDYKRLLKALKKGFALGERRG
jgi:hypothetical protein